MNTILALLGTLVLFTACGIIAVVFLLEEIRNVLNDINRKTKPENKDGLLL